MAISASVSHAAGAAEGKPVAAFTHVRALDGIRGVAILLVLVDHLLWANKITGSSFLDIIGQLRGSAYCGVNLFFALSGFLITGILLDTLGDPHYFGTFYARRTLRIFPLYYGFLAALLLLTRPLHFVWSGWQYYFLTYTQNLAVWRLNVPLDIGSFNIVHFWSLQVEEQFYLLWPLIVYRLRRPESLARVALIACVVILAIRIFLIAMRAHHPAFQFRNLTYTATFSTADNILFGCCLCALLRTRWRETVLRLAPRVFAVSAAILVVTFIVCGGLENPASRFIPTFGYSVIAITCTAVIAMTQRQGSTTQRLFENDVLGFFGKYSYGIYVFHYSMAGWFTRPIRQYLNDAQGSKLISVVVGALIVGTLSVLVAMASYHLYETPFLRMKRFFRYRGEVDAARSEPPKAGYEPLAEAAISPRS
jgi:peptidoglycan/LPS O-acetylase OafA/YrhL